MADTILNIQTGTIDAPYQEFTETIPAGGCRKINYVTENFALLETSAPEALHVNFGGSSNETPFLAGMRYKLPAIVPNITLFNRSKTDLTVHFAVGCGEIDDNRLTVVSSINTVSTFLHFKTAGVTFSTSSCLIKTTGEKIVLQNNGGNDLYICDAAAAIGDVGGFKIVPGGDAELPITSGVRVNASGYGGTISVGVFSNLPISEIEYDDDGLFPGVGV